MSSRKFGAWRARRVPRAVTTLLEDEAPRTCRAVWDALLLEGDTYHAKRAGRELYTLVPPLGRRTGGAAQFGVEQKQGVELAVEEKNAAVGIFGARVVLVTADDRADAGEGKSVARRFCDDPQGIAYARPVTWDAKGDNTAAVIFLNVVEGDHFEEIGEVSREDLTR